jgi:GT2 family glycosyltransferase
MAAVREVGGYDERFSCGEDVDVCYRLGMAGWRLEINPQAVILHEDRAGTLAHFKRFRWYAVDQALLFRMYGAGKHRRAYINPYPWRRGREALGCLVRGLPVLAKGDASGPVTAAVTLIEVAGVLAGDIEGSLRHRVLYI